MYEFKSMNETTQEDTFSPSDNCMINGEPINEVIDGYDHLRVTGRSLVGQNISTSDTNSRTWITNIKDNSRTLTIEFILKTNSSHQMREKYAQLNQLLRSVNDDGYLHVSFADEPQWTYSGVLESVPDDPEQSLTLMSSFSIFCPIADKEKNVQRSSGAISLDYAVDINPDEIELTINNDTDNIIISNGRNEISMQGSYSAGDVIRLIYTDKEILLTKNGLNILTDLVQFAYPSEFRIRDGDVITADNAEVNNVVWRDRQL